LTYLLYTLSLISSCYEMVIIGLAFRERLHWRFGLSWLGIILALQFLQQAVTAWWPQLPLALIWIVPLTIVDTIMATRLLKTHWLIVLPIILSLNALKRLIGGIGGTFLKFALSADDPMRLRQAIGLGDLTASINLIGAAALGLPIIILIGLLAHHFVSRTNVLAFFQQVKVATSDYWLVFLEYAAYVLAYCYALEQPVVTQTYIAVVATLVFGTTTAYLVINNNNRLTDNQLLAQVTTTNEQLVQHQTQLESFHDDYRNTLLNLNHYIRNDDVAGLKAYYQKLAGAPAASPLTTTTITTLNQLNNPELRGLIYAKVETAASRGVQLQLNLTQPIIIRADHPIKVVRLLGSLLDTAIDNAAQTDQPVTLTIQALPSQVVQLQVSYTTLETISQQSGPLPDPQALADNQLQLTTQLNDQQVVATLTITA